MAAFVFGLLLAVTDYAWRPRIEQNQADKFSEKAGAMVQRAEKFVTAASGAEISLPDGQSAVVDIKKGVDAAGVAVAWAFVAEGSGFADKIRLVIAVDGQFEKIKGYGVLASNETPGYGDQIKNEYFKSQFVNAPAGELKLLKTGDPKVIDKDIIAISGATVTSEAMVEIFNNYVIPVKNYLQEKGEL